MGKKGKRKKNNSSASQVSDDKVYYIKESEAKPDLRSLSLLEKSLLEKTLKGKGSLPSVNVNDQDQADKRKQKKENQKYKKLRQKMAAERRQSEIFLSDIDTGGTGSVPSSTRKSGSISLYRCPLITMEYFLREILCLLGDVKERYLASRRRSSIESINFVEIFLIFLVITTVLAFTYFWVATIDDPLTIQMKQYIAWYFYWIFLGILSSVGLGTGLHTFVLYLGPFIAKVSLAAQECSSLDFPRPPYPSHIICPSDTGMGHSETPSILSIVAKVRWETLAWGFGTALGELPPYFVARAASLAGDDSNEDDLGNKNGCLAKVQAAMRDFVMKVGFWGILLCASIPNPLFDLAGITCGHFQIPFIIFFGATAIGKTIVKSQLQMIFVILAFNETSLERVIHTVSSIPRVGAPLSKIFTDFVEYQRSTLHSKGDVSSGGGVLKLIMEIVVFGMILYFVGSIINGMARSYNKRISPEPRKNSSSENKTVKTKKRLIAQT